MKIKNENKGFTLIELLVVVALIVTLAAIGLTFLNNARNGGNDAGVKTNLEGAKKQAEIYYLTSNTYGTFAVATCPLVVTAGSLFNDPVIIRALVRAVAAGSSTTRCIASVNGYAIAVSYKNSSNSWCVDGHNVSKQYAGTPTAAINAATARCN